MAKKYRPGRLAKNLIRGVGDVDVAVAGAESRHEVLSKMSDQEVGGIKESADGMLIQVEQRIKEIEKELKHIEEDHHKTKFEPIRHRVEQAAAWRSIGIEERIPNLVVPGPVRLAILGLLACLDFYIFAQAYAVDADVSGPSNPEFWLGGVLGLAVFIVGLVFTHGLKNLIASRAQRAMLREEGTGEITIDPAVRAKLVTIRASALSMLTSGLVFLVLLVAGVKVRVDGAANGSIATVVFQALIPLVAVAAELYLFDPFHRVAPGFGRKHRQLQKERAGLEHRIEGINRKMGHAIERVENYFGVEHAVLDVEQQDMGLQRSAGQSSGSPVP